MMNKSVNLNIIKKAGSIIISIALFFNGIVYAAPIQNNTSGTGTLNVQSIYNSFGKINSQDISGVLQITKGQYDETQINHEVLLILQMYLRGWIPHNIDAEIDKMLAEVYFERGKKRIFSVLPSKDSANKKEKTQGKAFNTAIELEIDQGPLKGKRFRIYSNCEKQEDLLTEKSKVWTKPVEQSEEQSLVAGRQQPGEQETGVDTLHTTYDIQHTVLKETPGRDYVFNENGQLWKVTDDKGIVWEENEYDEKNELKTVYLYIPETGKRIKCERIRSGTEYIRYEGRELLTREWKVMYEFGQSFIDSEQYSHFSVKEVYENRGKGADVGSYLCQTNIQLKEVPEEADKRGTGKAIKRWVALKAFREKKTLKVTNTYSPVAANISCGLYDRSTLTVYRGDPYVERAVKILWDKNSKEKLEDIVFEERYWFEYLDEAKQKYIEAEISVEKGTKKVTVSDSFPKEYTYRIDSEKRKLYVYNSEEKIIPIKYFQVIHWDGSPDVEKITDKQDAEESVRALKEYDTSHVPRATLKEIPGRNYIFNENGQLWQVTDDSDTVWEEYEYNNKGEVDSVILYNSLSDGRIKCKKADKFEKTLDRNYEVRLDERWQIFFEHNPGEFLSFPEGTNLKIKKSLQEEDFINVTYIGVEGGPSLRKGAAKTVLRWAALNAYRKGKGLEISEAIGPKEAWIYIPFFQINSLTLFQDNDDTLLFEEFTFTDRKELEKKIVDQKYIVSDEHRIIRVRVDSEKRKIETQDIDGYYYDLDEHGRLSVRKKIRGNRGENLSIRYLNSIDLKGMVDAKGLAAIQDKEKREAKNRVPFTYYNDSGNIGKQYKVLGSETIIRKTSKGKQVKKLEVKAINVGTGKEENLLFNDVEKKGVITKEQKKNIENICVQPESKLLLKRILSTYPENIYQFAYKEKYGDLFGFNRPYENMVFLHKELINDPVAKFHEFCHVLIDKKDPRLNDPELPMYKAWELGGLMDLQLQKGKGKEKNKHYMQVKIKGKFQQHYEELLPQVDVTDAIKKLVKDGEYWVRDAVKNLKVFNLSEDKHYHIRIFQRALFGEADRKLTEKIKELQKDDFEERNANRIGEAHAADLQEVINEIKEDMDMDKNKINSLEKFYKAYIDFGRKTFGENSNERTIKQIEESFSAENIADLFYLKEKYGFDIFGLLVKKGAYKPTTNWIDVEEKESGSYGFTVGAGKNIIMKKEGERKQILIKETDNDPFFFEKKGGYINRVQLNFLVKLNNFMQWADKKEFTRKINIKKRKNNKKEKEFYSLIGAEIQKGTAKREKAVFYTMGDLSAGLLSRNNIARVKEMDERLLLNWSQRKIDKYLSLTEGIPIALLQKANKAFSIFLGNRKNLNIPRVTPEKSAEFVLLFLIIINELEKDITFTKEKYNDLYRFLMVYIIRNDYVNNYFTEKQIRGKINRKMYAEWIADLFYLKDLYGFDILQLEIGGETKWVLNGENGKKEKFIFKTDDINYIGAINVFKDQIAEKNMIAGAWSNNYWRTKFRKKGRALHKDKYRGRNIGNFLIKTLHFCRWDGCGGKKTSIIIQNDDADLARFYKTIGAGIIGDNEYAQFTLIGSINAGIIPENKIDTINGLNKFIWRTWSQRKMDRYFRLTDDIKDPELHAKIHKAFSDAKKDLSKKALMSITPEEVAEFVNNKKTFTATQDIPPKEKEKPRREKETKKHPGKFSITSANLFRSIDKYLRSTDVHGKKIPIDIIIDLALMNDRNESILQGNIEEIARLMLAYRDYKNINICFERTKKKDSMGEKLIDNIERSPQYEEIADDLAKEIKKQVKKTQITNEVDSFADSFMKERVNKKRANSIKVSILTEEYLGWMKEFADCTKYFDKDNYPVALEGQVYDGTNMALWDFEGAFVMSLVKASLGTAKKNINDAKDDEKEHYEKEYSELKKEILPRINKFFSERGEFEDISERSLDNMVANEIMARITLALKFALPPIMRDVAEKIEQIQKSTYRIMRDA